MTATETKLKPLHYGLLRLISDETELDFDAIHREAPGISPEILREDLITLVERGLLRASYIMGERCVRYRVSHTGIMLLRQFERDCLPKPEQRSTKQVLAGFGLVILTISVLAYLSSLR